MQTRADDLCRVTAELQSKAMLSEAELEEFREANAVLKREQGRFSEDTLSGICTAAISMLDQSQEDLLNATSITYPTRRLPNQTRCNYHDN